MKTMREMIAEQAAAEERKAIIRMIRRTQTKYRDIEWPHAVLATIIGRIDRRQDRYLKSKRSV